MYQPRCKALLLVLGVALAVGLMLGDAWLGKDFGIASAAEPMTFTPEQKRRAQQLFRNYCMDCHGPKLTGEKFDKTLLCPNVQGKSVEDYQDNIEKGPDVMPAFQVFFDQASDGNLILNYDDFILLSNHEATFNNTQP